MAIPAIGHLTVDETQALAIRCLSELGLKLVIEVIKEVLGPDDIDELVSQLEGE